MRVPREAVEREPEQRSRLRSTARGCPPRRLGIREAAPQRTCEWFERGGIVRAHFSLRSFASFRCVAPPCVVTLFLLSLSLCCDSYTRQTRIGWPCSAALLCTWLWQEVTSRRRRTSCSGGHPSTSATIVRIKGGWVCFACFTQPSAALVGVGKVAKGHVLSYSFFSCVHTIGRSFRLFCVLSNCWKLLHAKSTCISPFSGCFFCK